MKLYPSLARFIALLILFGLCVGLLGISCHTVQPPVRDLSSTQDVPQLVLPAGHTDCVYSVAFSPDGRYVLSGSVDNTLKLWEVSTGREVRSFKGHIDWVFSVAFSLDGRYVLSGSRDYTLKLWEVSTGHEVRSFDGHTSSVLSVAFSLDGRYVLSGSVDNTLKLWEVSTGQEIRSFKGHKDYVYSVAFSPDGRYVLSGASGGALKMWKVSEGLEVRTFEGHTKDEAHTNNKGYLRTVYSVVFSPDGRYALSGSTDETLKLWEVSTGQEVRSFSGHRSGVRSVAFSPDGRYALSGSADNTLKLWEVSTGREIRTFEGHTNSVWSVAFSPDGRYVLSGSVDNTLKLWEVSTGQEIRSFSGHTGWVTSVAFSPDGRYALCGSRDGILDLWKVSTGRKVRPFEGSGDWIKSVAFSPDGRYVLSGSWAGILKLWEVSTGQEIRSFDGHTDESGAFSDVESVAFSPDGRYALSGSVDNTLKLWEVSTRREVHTFTGHTGYVRSVAFSPDARHVISGSDDNTLKLWEASTGREVRSFNGHIFPVYAVAFSPDGRYVLSGSGDETLKLWEVSTGREVRSLEGHTASVLSVAFSPDGRYALSTSYKTLKLWEVSTGREVRRFKEHIHWATSVAFSPDGRYALSGSADGSLDFWEVSTGDLVFTRLYLDSLDWVIVTPDGRFDGSPGGIKLLHYAKDNRSIPLDALFDRFYTPNLVARVLSGESAPNASDIRKGIEMPPKMHILSPTAGQTLRKRTVEVEVEAEDQGGGVEDIRLFHNGKRVGGTGRGIDVKARRSKGVRRTFTVSLVSGENTLRAMAFSRDRTESHPFEITIQVEIAEATTDLHLVAVGINRYKNRRYNLNYGVPDAQALVGHFRAKSAGMFRSIRVQTVFDEEATRLGIEAALEEVAQKTRPEDVFVFYYAGHGVMTEGSADRPADFYLVPVDVTRMYGNEEALMEKAISATRLRKICQQIEARKQLVILDACQSGQAVETFVAGRGAAEEKAIAQLARSAGLVVLASTQSEQLASEFADLGHGLFTYTLLQGMAGEADGSPRDGRVTVRELSAYIDARIPELSERYHGEPQYPNVFVRGQDFPVSVP